MQLAASSVTDGNLVPELRAMHFRATGRTGLHLRTSESALLAAAITILAGLSVIRVVEWKRVAGARVTAQNAERAFRVTGQLAKTLLDAEIEEREYLLTGDKNDLHEVQEAIESYPEHLKTFQEAARNAGSSQAEIQNLSELSNKRFERVRSDLGELQAQNRAPVLQSIKIDEREGLLTQQQSLEARMSNQYLASISSGLQVIEKLNHASLIEFSLGTCCVLVILVGTALRLNDAFGRQTRLVSELSESEQRYRMLVERLERVREEERARLAREIHDELGQALTGIKMDLGLLNRRLEIGEASGALDQIRETSTAVDETIRSLQRIATELRPAILDHLGLVAAIDWLAREFQTRSRISVRLTLPETEPMLSGDERTCLFRIVQEAFTNVARHANAQTVRVVMSNQSGLTLSINDDGAGFCLTERSSSSIGLAGMRERARLINAEMELQTAEGEGTTVTVRLCRTDDIASEMQDAAI
ncbi:MAG TPA: histidine kinase [Bryobacteraceae bacterium]|nr:histidine kinase [Bryobacteraceae bacterium]